MNKGFNFNASALAKALVANLKIQKPNKTHKGFLQLISHSQGFHNYEAMKRETLKGFNFNASALAKALVTNLKNQPPHKTHKGFLQLISQSQGFHNYEAMKRVIEESNKEQKKEETPKLRAPVPKPSDPGDLEDPFFLPPITKDLDTKDFELDEDNPEHPIDGDTKIFLDLFFNENATKQKSLNSNEGDDTDEENWSPPFPELLYGFWASQSRINGERIIATNALVGLDPRSLELLKKPKQFMKYFRRDKEIFIHLSNKEGSGEYLFVFPPKNADDDRVFGVRHIDDVKRLTSQFFKDFENCVSFSYMNNRVEKTEANLPSNLSSNLIELKKSSDAFFKTYSLHGLNAALDVPVWTFKLMIDEEVEGVEAEKNEVSISVTTRDLIFAEPLTGSLNVRSYLVSSSNSGKQIISLKMK